MFRHPKRKILVCGNGGSAALANHFACDHQKILNETKKLKPFLVSLTANSALMTAISNDDKYENVFGVCVHTYLRVYAIYVYIYVYTHLNNIYMCVCLQIYINIMYALRISPGKLNIMLLCNIFMCMKRNC